MEEKDTLSQTMFMWVIGGITTMVLVIFGTIWSHITGVDGYLSDRITSIDKEMSQYIREKDVVIQQLQDIQQTREEVLEDYFIFKEDISVRLEQLYDLVLEANLVEKMHSNKPTEAWHFMHQERLKLERARRKTGK